MTAPYAEMRWNGEDLSLGQQRSINQIWLIFGVDDLIDAAALLADTVPETYGPLVLSDVKVDRKLTPSIWEASVVYGDLPQPEVGSPPIYEFDTGGGTQKIKQSIATMGRYGPSAGATFAWKSATDPANEGSFKWVPRYKSVPVKPGTTAPIPGSAPTGLGQFTTSTTAVRAVKDYQGAICVTKDGVEGTEIPAPALHFSERHFLDDSQVTPEYKVLCSRLTGCINNAPFKGFAAGEVRFLGAQGSKRGEELWEVTYKFEASENATDIVVSTEITGVNKRGWDFLWCDYAETVDETAGGAVRRPMGAYVEQVSHYADLSLLGIGS